MTYTSSKAYSKLVKSDPFGTNHTVLQDLFAKLKSSLRWYSMSCFVFQDLWQELSRLLHFLRRYWAFSVLQKYFQHVTLNLSFFKTLQKWPILRVAATLCESWIPFSKIQALICIQSVAASLLRLAGRLDHIESQCARFGMPSIHTLRFEVAGSNAGIGWCLEQ